MANFLRGIGLTVRDLGGRELRERLADAAEASHACGERTSTWLSNPAAIEGRHGSFIMAPLWMISHVDNTILVMMSLFRWDEEDPELENYQEDAWRYS